LLASLQNRERQVEGVFRTRSAVSQATAVGRSRPDERLRGRDQPSERIKRDKLTLRAKETDREEVNGLTKPRTLHVSRPEGADLLAPEPSPPPPPAVHLPQFMSAVPCARALTRWRLRERRRCARAPGEVARHPLTRGAEQWVSDSMRPEGIIIFLRMIYSYHVCDAGGWGAQREAVSVAVRWFAIVTHGLTGATLS